MLGFFHIRERKLSRDGSVVQTRNKDSHFLWQFRRCVTNSHVEVLKKFATFTGKQLRLNPFTEHHLTKTLDMYKSITFQIWIVLEIRLGLHCPKKRSFLLRISSVNVSKSADFWVANIYDLIHSYIILKKIRRFPYFYIASLTGILI